MNHVNVIEKAFVEIKSFASPLCGHCFDYNVIIFYDILASEFTVEVISHHIKFIRVGRSLMCTIKWTRNESILHTIYFWVAEAEEIKSFNDCPLAGLLQLYVNSSS